MFPLRSDENGGDMTEHSSASAPLMFVASEDVTLLVGLAIEWAMICWIGAVPGAAGDNRFGPPPPFTLKRVLTAR